MNRMADNLITQFTKEEQGFAYLAYLNDMNVGYVEICCLMNQILVYCVSLSSPRVDF